MLSCQSKKIRAAFCTLFLAGISATLLAQAPAAQPVSSTPPTQFACADQEANFRIKKVNESSTAPATSGKADIYLIGNVPRTELFMKTPVVFVGMDGKWIGATRGKSYFQVQVNPGTHHLCVMSSAHLAFNSFTAEPGHAYYFLSSNSVNLVGVDGGATYNLVFNSVNDDEGAYLISQYQEVAPK